MSELSRYGLPVLALWMLGPCTNSATADRPNFVVILADDLGYSDLGCYGGEIQTPHLDALADNGLKYTQFYNTARCWPTRCALLTGYYAQQIRRDAMPGLPGGGHGQRPAWAKLLPELLRDQGYHSYHSGKWHIDGGQLQGGFERSYSLDDHDRFFSPRKHTLDGQSLPPVERDAGFYTTTAITDHAIDWLTYHQQAHDQAPFFLYVAFNCPHFPLQAPPDDVAAYQGRYRDGWDMLRAERWRVIQSILQLPGKLSALEPEIGPPYHFPEALRMLGDGEVNRELAWLELTPQQQEFQASKMSIHAAMVHRMDLEVGRLLNHMRSMRVFDNTVIVFLSDNGASAEIMVRGDGHDAAAEPGSADSYLCLGPGWSSAANTPFRRHKTWVHEGGIATPCIVHWPQGIEAPGGLRQTVGHVIDIAPTFVKLAGGTWPTRYGSLTVPVTPGRDLSITFHHDEQVDRSHLWWMHEGHRAIRAGDWKLVAARSDPWSLYNLQTDRAETEDLASQFPDRVEQLAQLWEKTRDDILRVAGSEGE